MECPLAIASQLAAAPMRVFAIGINLADDVPVQCPHDTNPRKHCRVPLRRHRDQRLTRPYRPQTNGLVERFNRRITEAIGREPKRGSARRTFPCDADRDAFLNRFVADYNRTRLKCLGYLAPLEALANLPGPNT